MIVLVESLIVDGHISDPTILLAESAAGIIGVKRGYRRKALRQHPAGMETSHPARMNRDRQGLKCCHPAEDVPAEQPCSQRASQSKHPWHDLRSLPRTAARYGTTWQRPIAFPVGACGRNTLRQDDAGSRRRPICPLQPHGCDG